MAEFEDLKKMSSDGEVLPFNVAMVHLGLGDSKLALDYLEHAYAVRFANGWDGSGRIASSIRSDRSHASWR